METVAKHWFGVELNIGAVSGGGLDLAIAAELDPRHCQNRPAVSFGKVDSVRFIQTQ